MAPLHRSGLLRVEIDFQQVFPAGLELATMWSRKSDFLFLFFSSLDVPEPVTLRCGFPPGPWVPWLMYSHSLDALLSRSNTLRRLDELTMVISNPTAHTHGVY